MEINTIFANKKVNFASLENFGFIKELDNYVYYKDILNKKYHCLIIINKDGIIKGKVYDNLTNEEYILIHVKSVQGNFVTKVREEYEKILKDIAKTCFDKVLFKSEVTREVVKYLKDKYGDDPEFPWEDNNAIIRHKENKKWYAAILTIKKEKLGIKAEEEIEVINLKNKPEIISKIVDNKKYFHGYHMNKKHWITLCLDDTLKISEIKKFIDESYNLTK